MVTGLLDAYNLLLSGAMDDMQSVANAFLALYGMQGTTQGDIDEANRTRILSLAEGGRAEFVVKNLNHEALAQLESNLRRSILELNTTPHGCFIRPFGCIRYHKNTSHLADVVKGCIFPV